MEDYTLDPSNSNSQFGQSLTTTSVSDLGGDAHNDVVNEITSNLSSIGELYGNGTPFVTGSEARVQNAPTVVSAGIDEVPTMLPSTYASDGREDYGMWQSMPVSVYETHKELSDGSFIPKYQEGYWGAGIDHDNLYGSQMSRLTKWGRGLNKFAQKTATRIVGGTVGFIYGIGAALNKGELSALYNNDVSKALADYETELNTDLANYLTKEERNASLAAQMITANFWADTVMDGVSFVTSTVATEALWASLTGGASLTASMARYGLKTAVKKGIKSASLKMLSKTATKAGKRAVRRSLLNASNWTKAAHTARFAITSGFYESSQESYQSLVESTEAFVDNYMAVYGRAPSGEEMAEFRKSAVSEANNVFAQNLVVTGTGNMVLIGSHFGVGKGLGKFLKKAGNRFSGTGITSTIKAVDGMERLSFGVNPTKWQKVLGRTTSVLKNPISEGIQEGVQGVISNASANILEAQYNPGATEHNFSRVDAYIEGFKEAFGTKEGLTEVVVGGLIGGGSTAVGRVKQARRGGKLFGTAYGDELRSKERQSKVLQGTFDNIINMATNENTLRKLLNANAIDSYIKESGDHRRAGNEFQSNMAFKKAVVSHMIEMEKSGMSEDNKEDLHFAIETARNTMKEQGMTDSQIESWQSEAKENLEEWSNDVKKSYDYGQRLGLDAYNKASLNPLDAFVHVNVMGKNSYQEMVNLADKLSKVVSGANPETVLINKVSNETKLSKLVDQATSVEDEIAKAESQMKEVVRQISEVPAMETNLTPKNFSGRLEKEGKQGRKKVDELNKERNDLIDQLETLRKEQKKVKREIEIVYKQESSINISESVRDLIPGDDNSEWVSADDIVTARKQLKELDETVRNLEQLAESETDTKTKKGYEKQAGEIKHLMDELDVAIAVFQDYNRTTELMSDPRFMRQTFRGIFKPLREAGKKFDDKEFEGDTGGLAKKIESIIQKGGDKISEDDKYTMRAVARMMMSYTATREQGGVEDRRTSNKVIQTIISEDEWYNDPDKIETIATEAISDNKVDEYRSYFESENTDSDKVKSEMETAKSLYDNKTVELAEEKSKSSTIDDVLPEKYNIVSQADLKLNQDIESFRNQLLELINKGLGSLFFYEGVKEDLKLPTEEEIAEFLDLKANKNRSSAEEKRVIKLEERLSYVGLGMGTMTGEGVPLTDIIDVYFGLDSKIDKGLDGDVIEVVSSIDEMKEVSNDATKDNSGDDIAQSYDKAVISRTEDKSLTVHNISNKGLRKLLESVVGNVLDTSNPDGSATWEFEYQGTMRKMLVGIDEKGNTIIHASGENNGIYILNNNTPFFLPFIQEGTSRKYESLYIQKGGVGLPVKSDLEVGSRGQRIDNDAVYRLKDSAKGKGSKLIARVDADSSYNKRLIAEYIKNPTAENRARIMSLMAIQLVDTDGNIVGVLKGLYKNEDEQNQEFTALRRQAANRILKDQDNRLQNKSLSDKQVHGMYDLSADIRVKRLFYGFPNIVLNMTNDVTSVALQKISHESKKMIVDVGYMLNGRLNLRDETEGVDSKSMMGKIFKNSRDGMPLYNKKVPVVVIEFNGKNIAYPVSFLEKSVTFAEEVQKILYENGNLLKGKEQVKELNNILADYGLLDELGAVQEYTQEEMNDILNEYGSEMLKEQDIGDKLLDQNFPMEEILTDMYTNIDFANKPFHSPKFTYEITNIDKSVIDPSVIQVLSKDEVLPFAVNRESKEEQEKPC